MGKEYVQDRFGNRCAMPMDRIVLHDQREDDILYVIFGQEGRKGIGINLHNNRTRKP